MIDLTSSNLTLTRVDNGRETARDGTNGRNEQQGKDGKVNVPSQRQFDEQRPGVEIHADLGEDVQHEGE